MIPRTIRARLLEDGEHYAELVMGALSRARVSAWIATANVKTMLVEAPIGTRARARGRFISGVELLVGLAKRGVEVKLLHAGEPSRPFRAELEKHARSEPRFEMRQCPRVHLKMVAVDGSWLYLGSANLTGAGLGAKGEGRRNFEMGVVTDDHLMLDAAQARYFRIWSGAECGACKLRASCPKPLDELTKRPDRRTRAASR